MLTFHFTRTWPGVLLLLGMLCRHLEAQESAVPSAGVFKRLEKVFHPDGTLEIKGKPWMVVTVGPLSWSVTRHGWLMKDEAHTVVLFDEDNGFLELRKPGLNEVRPEKLQGEGDLQTVFRQNHSTAWKVQQADYVAHVKEAIAAGLPKEDDYQPSSWNYRGALDRHVIKFARRSVHASLAGELDRAKELYAFALRGWQHSEDLPSDQLHAEFYQFVADRVAFNTRGAAIFEGHRGEPRQELRELWRQVTVIPDHDYHEEAEAMVGHYDSLLKEDAAWVEPDKKTLEQMTPEQKVAYYIYHLRDLDVEQGSEFRQCNVLTPGAGFQRTTEFSYYAVELKKLGIVAIPQLIEHLDDPRPTRCEAYWRRHTAVGRYLLCYGDCCQQIFESITGETIFDREGGDYPILAGKGKECKAKAEKWWREYQEKQAQQP